MPCFQVFVLLFKVFGGNRTRFVDRYFNRLSSPADLYFRSPTRAPLRLHDLFIYFYTNKKYSLLTKIEIKIYPLQLSHNAPQSLKIAI